MPDNKNSETETNILIHIIFYQTKISAFHCVIGNIYNCFKLLAYFISWNYMIQSWQLMSSLVSLSYRVGLEVTKPVDLSHKPYNVPLPYHTIHRFVTETYAHVHIFVTKWCIVGYLFYILRFVRWINILCSLLSSNFGQNYKNCPYPFKSYTYQSWIWTW